MLQDLGIADSEVDKVTPHHFLIASANMYGELNLPSVIKATYFAC